MSNVKPNLRLLFSGSTVCVSSYISRLSLITLIVLVVSASLLAQDGDDMPDDVVPPPLKTISKDEKERLAAEPGVKDKTALYVALLDERLRKAEDYCTRESYTDALTQFGVYEGLLESAMGFLKAENKSGKALSGFRRIEMTLRAQNIKIETIRRTMPYKYAFHILRLQKVIRRTRAEAAESLFSDSVVPEAVEKKP